jgi:hypothetical protein
MAQGRDYEFLTVHWTIGDSKGAIDYLPSRFVVNGATHDLKHEFLDRNRELSGLLPSISD